MPLWRLISVVGLWVMLSVCATPGWGADAAKGEVVARVRCMTCHFLDRNEHKIGPGLLGVYGRAPSISGVPFARWDEHALEIWLSDPRKVKPNTTMLLPPLPPGDREDVIAYLRQQSLKLSASPSASPASP
jgi:cytochrome c